MIYLDNAATTQVRREVVDAMIPYLTENYGNAGSLYSLGRKSAEAVDIARGQVAELINADKDSIIFTSGGTEANNLVFKGLVDYLIQNGKTHIITSCVEHDSVIHATEELIKLHFDVQYLPVNRLCKVDLKALMESIREDTGLVSIMYVNNEVGAINEVQKIAEICREKNVLFHTDCVQALGMQEIDVDNLGVDFLSISSHKIHGCKGVGCLYARDKSIMSPLISGGANQEYGLRGGTENVAGIVGFGKACEILCKNFTDIQYRTRALRYFLSSQLKDAFGDQAKILIDEEYSKVVSVTFKGIDAQTMVLLLDNQGVYVSAGSACRSFETTPSRTLSAMGLSDEEARCTLRLSVSDFNSRQEIIDAVKIISNCVDLLNGDVVWD